MDARHRQYTLDLEHLILFYRAVIYMLIEEPDGLLEYFSVDELSDIATNLEKFKNYEKK